jgi:hypothetical protein
MVYKPWKSSTINTHRSEDHWRMFSEDPKSSRGILSWLEDIQRYLGIVMGIQGGVEEIVLRKGGITWYDTERR